MAVTSASDFRARLDNIWLIRIRTSLHQQQGTNHQWWKTQYHGLWPSTCWGRACQHEKNSRDFEITNPQPLRLKLLLAIGGNCKDTPLHLHGLSISHEAETSFLLDNPPTTFLSTQRAKWWVCLVQRQDEYAHSHVSLTYSQERSFQPQSFCKVHLALPYCPSSGEGQMSK